jgi:hypothetical protein
VQVLGQHPQRRQRALDLLIRRWSKQCLALIPIRSSLMSDQFSGLNAIPVPGTLRDSLVLLSVVLEQQSWGLSLWRAMPLKLLYLPRSPR